MRSIINNSRDLLKTIFSMEDDLLNIKSSVSRLHTAKASITQPVDGQMFTWDEELSMLVNTLWHLPAADGAAGDILYTDGAGNLNWIAPGAAAVAGNDTEVQLNRAGVMGTDPLFTFDYTNNILNAINTEIRDYFVTFGTEIDSTIKYMRMMMHAYDVDLTDICLFRFYATSTYNSMTIGGDGSLSYLGCTHIYFFATDDEDDICGAADTQQMLITYDKIDVYKELNVHGLLNADLGADIDIPGNVADAFLIHEGVNNYIEIDTNQNRINFTLDDDTVFAMDIQSRRGGGTHLMHITTMVGGEIFEIDGGIIWTNVTNDMHIYGVIGLIVDALTSTSTLRVTACADAGADYNKFLVLDDLNYADYRTGAELLSDLSGDAAASFDWNLQELDNVGNIGVGTPATTGHSLRILRGVYDDGILIIFGLDAASEHLEFGVMTNRAIITAGHGSDAGDTDLLIRTSNGGAEMDRVWIKHDGDVGINEDVPWGKFDVAEGNIALFLGADNTSSGNTRTDSADKSASIGVLRWDIDDLGSCFAYFENTSTENIINIGGGNNLLYAATEINIYTAANNATSPGTVCMTIDTVISMYYDLYMDSDSKSIYFGDEQDAHIYYDGTDLRIITDNVAASDLVLDCGSNKTLELAETVYDDLQFPVSTGKVPASNFPNWESFTTNTYAYSFDVDDYIDTHANEPAHGWKEGTNGHLHLHVAPKTTNSTGANRYVKFTVYVAKANINSVFVETSYSAELTIPNGTVAKKHMYLDVGNINMAGHGLSTQMMIRIKRIAATGGTEYGDSVFVLQCGVHLEHDTIGSRQESTK